MAGFSQVVRSNSNSCSSWETQSQHHNKVRVLCYLNCFVEYEEVISAITMTVGYVHSDTMAKANPILLDWL